MEWYILKNKQQTISHAGWIVYECIGVCVIDKNYELLSLDRKCLLIVTYVVRLRSRMKTTAR